ncbi:MAG: transcriptional repressor [Gammaproteobacteria bacterium]|nr:transcriptional repressor [Gammaproteobacteria bacterium]
MNKAISSFPLARDEVIALLRQHGITPTRQRLVIAQQLFQKQQHLSADHILESVNLAGGAVSRATVYNTMALFSSKGLVREVLIDRERVFYDSNNCPHHHVYNLDTGELKDIQGTLDMNIENFTGLPEGYRVVDTEVVVKISQN